MNKSLKYQINKTHPMLNSNIPFPASEIQIILSNCSCVRLLIQPPIYIDLLGRNDPGCLIPLQI